MQTLETQRYNLSHLIQFQFLLLTHYIFQSLSIVQSFEHYVSANPQTKIIDPFDNLRQLLDRYQTYSKINNSDLHKAGLFPRFLFIARIYTSSITHL